MAHTHPCSVRLEGKIHCFPLDHGQLPSDNRYKFSSLVYFKKNANFISSSCGRTYSYTMLQSGLSLYAVTARRYSQYNLAAAAAGIQAFCLTSQRNAPHLTEQTNVRTISRALCWMLNYMHFSLMISVSTLHYVL